MHGSNICVLKIPEKKYIPTHSVCVRITRNFVYIQRHSKCELKYLEQFNAQSSSKMVFGSRKKKLSGTFRSQLLRYEINVSFTKSTAGQFRNSMRLSSRNYIKLRKNTKKKRGKQKQTKIHAWQFPNDATKKSSKYFFAHFIRFVDHVSIPAIEIIKLKKFKSIDGCSVLLLFFFAFLHLNSA